MPPPPFYHLNEWDRKTGKNHNQTKEGEISRAPLKRAGKCRQIDFKRYRVPFRRKSTIPTHFRHVGCYHKNTNPCNQILNLKRRTHKKWLSQKTGLSHQTRKEEHAHNKNSTFHLTPALLNAIYIIRVNILYQPSIYFALCSRDLVWGSSSAAAAAAVSICLPSVHLLRTTENAHVDHIDRKIPRPTKRAVKKQLKLSNIFYHWNITPRQLLAYVCPSGASFSMWASDKKKHCRRHRWNSSQKSNTVRNI